MKTFALAALIAFVAVAFVAMGPTNSFAQQKQKIEKFGEDKRNVEWGKKKWETSAQKFTMRLSDPWGGLNFHEMSIHFADSVQPPIQAYSRLGVVHRPAGRVYITLRGCGRERPSLRAAAATSQTATSPEGTAIYCTNCGKRASTNDRFCRPCGTPLRS